MLALFASILQLLAQICCVLLKFQPPAALINHQHEAEPAPIELLAAVAESLGKCSHAGMHQSL